jgi:hypothetical protein
MALTLPMGSLLTQYTYAVSFLSNTGITKVHMRVLPRKLEDTEGKSEELRLKKALPVVISSNPDDSNHNFWEALGKIFAPFFNE